MKSVTIIIIVLVLFGSFACTESSNKSQEGPSEVINMEPYWRGQRLYRAHCQNCHQESGEGVGRIYPPLAKSDYLLANQSRAIRVIKNGLNETITVNGQEFNNAMPNNVKFVDDDIAALMTYIGNTWGNNMGNVSQSDVRKALDHSK